MEQALLDAHARHTFEIRMLEEQHKKDLKVLYAIICSLFFFLEAFSKEKVLMLVDRDEEVGQCLVKFRLVFHKGWEGTW